jgi:hypothetical protein
MRSVALVLATALPLLAATLPVGLVAQDGELGETIPYISLPAEFDRVLGDYEARWGAGDGDGLAELFTEDGFVLSNQRRPARGEMRSAADTTIRAAIWC